MLLMSQFGRPQYGFRLFKNVAHMIGAVALLFFAYPSFVCAQGHANNSEETVVHHVTETWIDGSPLEALDIVEEELRNYSHSLPLIKLRGDIRTTIRQNQHALEDYEAVLKKTPESLAVRWAKWSVLTRLGKSDLAITELQRIAQGAATNPLGPLRLAQELRKLDRLEESVQWHQKAVELVPEMSGWRLNMARALFDVLQYDEALKAVQHVLQTVPRDSPVEMAARNLLMITYGATKERGRRYQPIFSPEGTAEERKEWAAIRADSWRLFEAGRYKEAEPLLRKVLDLKPSDYGATHDLGLTLMELGRCEEAISVLEKVLTMTASDEVYADTFFRIGQCLVEMEQWPEALVHFEILYDAAIEFEQSTKGVPVTAGIRVLDTKKLEPWLEKVRPHVSGTKSPKVDDANAPIQYIDPSSSAALTEEELYRKIASTRLKPDHPINTRASLMGRDADFSWFRFVIPARRVMRDNLQAGNHEFIPIDPNDTFPHTQQEIYLVFALVTASYDAIPLTAECYRETSPITWGEAPLVQDQVVMSTNEQSGYFVLTAPKSGWTAGLYRCGLFVGDTVSAYTQSDEVRFRIMGPNQPS